SAVNLTTRVELSYGRQRKRFEINRLYFSMLDDAEHGRISLALCGDLIPSRRLAIYREPEFLALRELLRGVRHLRRSARRPRYYSRRLIEQGESYAGFQTHLRS